jgi:hypothetical protein
MRFLNHLKVSESGLKSFFLFVGYHGQSFIEGFNRNEFRANGSSRDGYDEESESAGDEV